MKKLAMCSLVAWFVCTSVTQAADVTGDRLDIGSGNTLSGMASTIAGGASQTLGGNWSAIGGGEGNILTNDYCTIAGGIQNTIDSGYSTISGGVMNSIVSASEGAFIGGGEGNSAVGAAYSAIPGGYYNASRATGAIVGGGSYNIAEGFLSTIPGGSGALASNHGQLAYAGGSFAGDFAVGGDAQTSIYVLRMGTTNSTQTEIFLDGASARMAIAEGASWTFDILIAGRNLSGDSAHYQVIGGIKNVSGTTSLVGTPTKTVIGEDVSGWDVSVSADNTNDALIIQVTGDSSSVRWVATVRTVEVKN